MQRNKEYDVQWAKILSCENEVTGISMTIYNTRVIKIELLFLDETHIIKGIIQVALHIKIEFLQALICDQLKSKWKKKKKKKENYDQTGTQDKSK